jgi:adenine C2-methylase RlmN of 23S rRNA A2503 and tRNA A37
MKINNNFLNVYNTEDNSVTKFIHIDGSETAIKNVISCSQDENFNNIYNDRKKYTIFISTSVGCFMKCSFCHLTMKNSIYKKLTNKDVLNNLKSAIKYKLNLNPELKDHYIKLSWMGMGDALIESNKVKRVSIQLLKWVIKNNYAKGLDGIDLSTVFPKTKNNWKKDFNDLNELLKDFPQNPNNIISINNEIDTTLNYIKRTPFRLFYSIHTLNNERRNEMIPNSSNVYEVIKKLSENDITFNVIFHHLFIEGLNDSIEEITELKKLMKSSLQDKELRILRYNFCDKSQYKESKNIKEIIKELLSVSNNIKVQISPGSEVKAACGQFIVLKFK